MEYNIVAIFITLIGLFVLFSKQMVKMSLISFLITLVLFVTLVIKGYYLLGLAYVTIEVLIKFELFLFLANKNLVSKKSLFKQQQLVKKLVTSVVLVVLVGIVHSFYKLKNTEVVKLEVGNLELLTIGSIVTIFLISGYVVKSQKWKQ
tara:strand:- start:35 stop:478 length:444 start_codon:yes stop_codon:yes gene_type:complete